MIAVLGGQLISKGDFVVVKNGPSTFQAYNGRTGETTNIDVMFDLGWSGWQLGGDGSRMAACAHGQVSVWDLGTGNELATFFGQWPGAHMPTIAVSNSGRYVATASIDQSINIWDVQEKKLQQQLLGMQRVMSIGQFGFSADNKRLTATDGINRKVWDVQTGREILSLAAVATPSFYNDFCASSPQTRFGLSAADLRFERLNFVESARNIQSAIKDLELRTLHQQAERLVFDRHSGEFDPARGLVKATRTLELSPTNPRYLLTHALANYHCENDDQALASLRMAIDSGFQSDPPTAAFAEFLLASCLKRVGKDAEAQAALNVANQSLLKIKTLPANYRSLAFEIAKEFLPPQEPAAANEPIIVNVLTDDINGISDGNISLREAAMMAADGGTIELAIEGTIELKLGQIHLDKALTIIGPGADMLTISAAGGAEKRIFNIDDGNRESQIPVKIGGLTLTGGHLTGVGPSSIGGAIRNLENLNISASSFENNSANFGGAILNEAEATLSITDSELTMNSAINRGGGIANYGDATITTSTFAGSSAGALGGGVANFDQATINNSTFSDNSANYGGGILNERGATLTITNSTLSENRATSNGGGISNFGAATLANNIVANSVNRPDIEGAGSFKGSHNLIEQTNVAGLTNTISVDPLLGPLADNGGPTKTHALLADSPAIDAGGKTELEFDQRGESFRRVNGAAADIGAFESK